MHAGFYDGMNVYEYAPVPVYFGTREDAQAFAEAATAEGFVAAIEEVAAHGAGAGGRWEAHAVSRTTPADLQASQARLDTLLLAHGGYRDGLDIPNAATLPEMAGHTTQTGTQQAEPQSPVAAAISPAAQPEGPDDSTDLLQFLTAEAEDAAADVEPPQPTAVGDGQQYRHFAYFTTRASAQAFAEAAAAAGMTVTAAESVEPIGEDTDEDTALPHPWEVQALARTAAADLPARQAQMENLAFAHDGFYDGMSVYEPESDTGIPTPAPLVRPAAIAEAEAAHVGQAERPATPERGTPPERVITPAHLTPLAQHIEAATIDDLLQFFAKPDVEAISPGAQGHSDTRTVEPAATIEPEAATVEQPAPVEPAEPNLADDLLQFFGTGPVEVTASAEANLGDPGQLLGYPTKAEAVATQRELAERTQAGGATTTAPNAVRFRPAGQADLAPSGEVSRIRANLAALRTLRTVQTENRPASIEEKQIMARWSGWGAVPAAVDPADTKYGWVRDELAGLLDDAELAAARRTVINAHYTDAGLVASIWDGVQQLGFTGGDVLEPGCGAGNFLAFAPDSARITGVELDPTTAAIAAALHPHADIRAESFAVTRAAAGQFDLTIGNVPFGDVRLHDKSHNRGNHAIHNHFIMKSLHLTRPGGLVAVITSAYTMDAANPAARREMAELGDLVGAVRLPSRAHAKAAGTDALTDVLILRRREPGREPAPFDWEYTVPVEIDGVTARINGYFADRPHRVLGTLAVGDGLYRHDELSVAGDPAAAPAQLQTALAEIAAEAHTAGMGMTERTGEPVAARAAARLPESVQRPDGYLRANSDGTFSRLDDGQFEPYQPVKKQAPELRSLLGLRDTAVALLEAEAASLDDTNEIDRLRTQLGTRYDNYVRSFGPINRFTDVERKTLDKDLGKMVPALDEETGEPLMRRIRPGQGGFRHDPFSPVVQALEHFDEESQTASKADIFTSRVVAPRPPRLGADSPAEALSISLDDQGAARLDTIAWLLGLDEAEARAALGELVYDDPATRRLEPAAAYLSGDVKTKLAQAKLAADEFPDRYSVNVAALTAVQPRDLGPEEISIKMGAPWVGHEVVQQFLAEILDDPHVKVEHDGGSMWSVHSATGRGVLATSTWGTDRRDAYDVATHILEQREFVIKDTISRDPRREVVNLDAIMAATEKAVEMKERFADWVWEDPQRATILVDRYNELFQRYVPRSYAGTQLSLPGLAMAFKPDEHQMAAVARILNEPGVGLYHCVGAGKTATMIMGAMELRRLGLVQKPVIVVPNQLIDQWAREFNRLYPQAKLLAAGSEDLSKERRQLMVARMATGNWDAVILTESAFEMLPMSTEAEKGYLSAQVADLDERIGRAMASGSERILKRLEKTKLNKEEKLKGNLDGAKDEGIWWELTGIDYIIRDESHRDKNLATASKVPNMSIKGSKRAQQMDLKLGWLRDNKDRWGVRATGTPMANSIVEIFTEFRYLRPDLMAQLGIHDVDSWLATFAEGKMIIEVTPDGGSLRTKTRLEFVNLDELVLSLHVFADVKTKDELNLDRPLLAMRPDGLRQPEMVLVPPSEELLEKVGELVDRAAKLRGTRPVKGGDNILKIVGEGSAAALDLRLVGLDTAEPQKIHVAADRIAGRYHANAARIYKGTDGEPHPNPGALQMVFSDLGTPDATKPEKWTSYGELRRQLVERGVPREKVAFIHDATDDRGRAELFAAARDGRIAVLISSTEKGGTGVNVQDRMISMSHLDCPYRPCDLEQRDGRADRRGNQNPEIVIERYVTERSLDAFKWQKVAFKSKQADLILTGRAGRRVEDISDVTISYEEMKAAATGNPLLVDHAKAKAELSRLERSLRGHQRNLSQLRWRINSNRQEIGINRQAIAEYDAALARRVPTRGDDFAITIKGTTYTKHEEANERLRTVLGLMLADRSSFRAAPTEIGMFGGFPMLAQADQIQFSSVLSAPGIRLTLDGLPSSIDMRDLAGVDVITRLQNRLAKIEEIRDDLVHDIGGREQDIVRAEQELDKPWRHEQALEEARSTFRSLEIEVAALAAAAENEANQQAAYAGEVPEPGPDGQPEPAQTSRFGGGPSTPVMGTRHTGPAQTAGPAVPAASAPATVTPAEVMNMATIAEPVREWVTAQLSALTAKQEVIDVARVNQYDIVRSILVEKVEQMFARSLDAPEVGGQDLAQRYFDDVDGFKQAFDAAASWFLFDQGRSAPPTGVEALRAEFAAYDDPALRRALNVAISPAVSPQERLSVYSQSFVVLSLASAEHRALIENDLAALGADGPAYQRAGAQALLARVTGTDEQLTVEQSAAAHAAGRVAHADMAGRTRRYDGLTAQAFAAMARNYRDAILEDLRSIAASNAPGRARRDRTGATYRTTAGFVTTASALLARFRDADTAASTIVAVPAAEPAADEQRLQQIRQGWITLVMEEQAPGLARAAGDPVRYLAEMLDATPPEREWIRQQLSDHPELLVEREPPLNPTQWQNLRREQARVADVAAESAMERGEFADAFAQLDQATAFNARIYGQINVADWQRSNAFLREQQAAAKPEPASDRLRLVIKGNSVLVEGTSREDTAARGALKAANFRWYSSLQQWGLPRNLKTYTRDRNISAFTTAMAKLGRPVEVIREGKTEPAAPAGIAATPARAESEQFEPLRETQRARRGHAFYPPADLAQQIPPLYGTDRQQPWDKTIHLHYFGGSHDFWLAEYDPKTGRAFGYINTGDPANAEWGYVLLPEIEAVLAQAGLMIIERDLYWTPKLASEIDLPGWRADNRRPEPEAQPAVTAVAEALQAPRASSEPAALTSFDQWRSGVGQRATAEETQWLHATITALTGNERLQQTALAPGNDLEAFRRVFEPAFETAMLDAFEHHPVRQTLLGWAFFDQGRTNRAQLTDAACAEVYQAITNPPSDPDEPSFTPSPGAGAVSGGEATAHPVQLARIGLTPHVTTHAAPAATPAPLSQPVTATNVSIHNLR